MLIYLADILLLLGVFCCRGFGFGDPPTFSTGMLLLPLLTN